MIERPLRLIKGEDNPSSPTDIALNYIDKLRSDYGIKEYRVRFTETSINNDFDLITDLEDTNTQLPFVRNGILIAVFTIRYLDSPEDNIMDHERYELRRIKSSTGLYKREVNDHNESVHIPCSPQEEELLAEVINILGRQKR
jgi:hypothetical protein